jgi:hypothetical protein
VDWTEIDSAFALQALPSAFENCDVADPFGAEAEKQCSAAYRAYAYCCPSRSPASR